MVGQHSYAEARRLISDGDLIAFRSVHGLIGKATQFFTRKKYTHTGNAIWIDGGLYVAELNGGNNHLTPLSQWEGSDFDVCHPPSQIQGKDMRNSIYKWIRQRVRYGYSTFLAVGLVTWLQVKAFAGWKGNPVCSMFSLSIYREEGWEEPYRLMSPGELVDLLEIKLKVRA